MVLNINFLCPFIRLYNLDIILSQLITFQHFFTSPQRDNSPGLQSILSLQSILTLSRFSLFSLLLTHESWVSNSYLITISPPSCFFFFFFLFLLSFLQILDLYFKIYRYFNYILFYNLKHCF